MTDSPTSHNFLGISIESREIRLVQVDGIGGVLSSNSAVLDPSRPLAGQIQEAIVESDNRFAALGIAIPGMVELDSGRVASSRITELEGLDLKAELRGVANGNIVVENDGNAAAFAEFATGAPTGLRDMIRISIGEGIGCGIVLGGKLWRGAKGFAGEIGSIVVDDEGTRLEEVASVPNIVRRTQNRFHQDSTSVLNKLKEDEIGLEDILAAAALKDDLALLMLERTGQYIGTAIAAVNNVLNLEAVFIGGQITNSNGILLNAIISRVGDCSSPRSFEGLEILTSVLDESAAAVGAALLAAQLRQP